MWLLVFYFWYVYFSLEDTFKGEQKNVVYYVELLAVGPGACCFYSEVGRRCPLFWPFAKLSSKVFCGSVLAADFLDRMARTSKQNSSAAKKRKFVVGVGPDGPYFQTECFSIRKRRRLLLELHLSCSSAGSESCYP